MRSGEFTELLHRRPFRPLRVHMSSGETIEVRHPDMAYVHQGSVDLPVPDPATGGPGDIQRFSLIHIVKIQFIDSQGRVDSNGAGPGN